MSTPTAEEVWVRVAACSACTCCPKVYGDRPCLRHQREAAEVWIAAQGLMCVKESYDGAASAKRYEFMPPVVAASMETIRLPYGLPSSILLRDGRWFSGGRLLSYETIEELLVHMGNYH